MSQNIIIISARCDYVADQLPMQSLRDGIEATLKMRGFKVDQLEVSVMPQAKPPLD